MRIEDLLPGTKVRCISATYGKGIPTMTDLVGSVVTIKSADDAAVLIDETPCLTWSPNDFEPIDFMVLTEPTEEEFMSILLGV